MEWIGEHFWTILAVGVFVELFLVTLFVRLRTRGTLATVLGVAAAVIALLTASRMIDTDGEQIARTLQTIAAALERNDVDAVLAQVSPAATALRADVPKVLARFEITETHLGDLDVRVDRAAEPPSAHAVFMGRVKAKDRRGESPYENFADRFDVTLEKADGVWRVLGYSEHRGKQY